MSMLAALLLGMATIASAPATTPSTRPSEAPRFVARRIDLSPDKASADAGAVPFDTRIALGTRLIDERLTGVGCIGGLVQSPTVQWRPDGDSPVYFQATARTEKGDAVVTWGGATYNGNISGEISISLPGAPLPRDVVEREHAIDPEAIRAKYRIVNARGELVNADELKRREVDAAFARNLAVARGRTLRFTFLAPRPTTVAAPATQPSRLSR